MKLSRVERWILSNQFHILEALYPDDADHYAKVHEALESGYELHYEWFSEHIYNDRDIMTPEENREVIEILSMFDSLKRAYGSLSDKTGIEESRVKFCGFDGNNETKQMGYARYFCTLKGGRFTDLDRGDNFNSHGPTLARYRRMLSEWKKSVDQNNLSKDDIIRIISL